MGMVVADVQWKRTENRRPLYKDFAAPRGKVIIPLLIFAFQQLKFNTSSLQFLDPRVQC